MDEEARYSEVFGNKEEFEKQKQRFSIRSNKTTKDIKKNKITNNGLKPNKPLTTSWTKSLTETKDKPKLPPQVNKVQIKPKKPIKKPEVKKTTMIQRPIVPVIPIMKKAVSVPVIPVVPIKQ